MFCIMLNFFFLLSTTNEELYVKFSSIFVNQNNFIYIKQNKNLTNWKTLGIYILLHITQKLSECFENYVYLERTIIIQWKFQVSLMILYWITTKTKIENDRKSLLCQYSRFFLDFFINLGNYKENKKITIPIYQLTSKYYKLFCLLYLSKFFGRKVVHGRKKVIPN